MNQEFPGQHVTTTTTTTSSSTFQRSLRFDPSYFRTMPGILKIIQMVNSKYQLFSTQVLIL